ncbi:MAG: hypothetical protein LBG27_04610 [Spirochaetaceae bacterium]|nr:hypothetical protein [Spirochaetaceae bacterium]
MKDITVRKRDRVFLRGGFSIGGFVFCAAVCVSTLGVSGCRMAIDEAVNSEGVPEDPPTEIAWFSGDASAEADSAIDLIRAAVGEQDTLSLLLVGGITVEAVSLDGSVPGKDFGEEGLVLNSGNSPADVILNGGGRTISLTGAANGKPVITVGPGVTLRLRNITFAGIDTNTAALIEVTGSGYDNPATLSNEASVGHLILEDGAVIKNNNNTAYIESEQSPPPDDERTDGGGGVRVAGSGIFTMNGGEISGNAADSVGGGVFIGNSGVFTMNGGTISGNSTLWGGGVHICDTSVFTMNGGTISGNGAYATLNGGIGGTGGGVNINGGEGTGCTFIMNGGIISGNSAGYRGGGVHILHRNPASASTFEMRNGMIGGNYAVMEGGGVTVDDLGKFKMSGGTIRDNMALGWPFSAGGGVAVCNTGAFDMSGGEISLNRSFYGGGVAIVGGANSFSSSFSKTGGTIYGADMIGMRNTALRGSGDAGASVYDPNAYPGNTYAKEIVKQRNATAGPGVVMHHVFSSEPELLSGWEEELP